MSGVVVYYLPRSGGQQGGGQQGGGPGEAPADGAVTLRLGPGQVARFGRGSATNPVELRLVDAAISRLAGEIRVTDDHWQLSNHSSTHSYLVENPEGAGEYLRVPPRRAAAPIPFEFARVVLPTRGSTPVSFQVFAPDHVYLEAGGAGVGGRGHTTVTAYSLDETARYFLVLVALCEPRLRDESPLAVPTTPEIVARLRGHPACAALTARAVSAQIDYLADEKMRIGAPTGAGARREARRNGKREALVGLALRFGLVREEHLALLPSRAEAGGASRATAR
ncbi:serine/threonine protein kinase [Streptomyces sp. RerS4]|uniref:serine/threonine protein kinase n=1 Tax=Streptomyces sp. RerS4 TaxID=2942449 RepID=UPI00201C2026|nr:serine/threonine protein kinase [Streptomyces sp. RerS4]UQW99576.1 serine/threonine protein kinase [Streptomyces sp. RerS4]